MAEHLSELIEEFCEVNKIHRWEGDSGLKNLEIVLAALGYERHHFEFGELVEVFLSDNPGAVQALIDWISAQDLPEWRASVESCLPEKDESEEPTKES